LILKKIAILGQPLGLLLIPYGHFEKLPFHLKTLIFQVPYTINRIKMPKERWKESDPAIYPTFRLMMIPQVNREWEGH